MGSCPQKCSQPQGASQQAHLVLPRAGSPGCFPVAGQSQWSPSQARCGQAIFCEPRCHAVWQAGGGTGQRHDTLSPAAVTESQWCTREPHSGCCGRRWGPFCGPGARKCCAGRRAAGHVPATRRTSPPGPCAPSLLGPLRLVEWSRTGQQMPLWAVPIPVGDVMPRGRGGLPQKLLPPGPGTQAWPGAPSQMEAGRYCISPGGKAGKARAGPWPQVWRGPVIHTLSGSPAPHSLKACVRGGDPPPRPHFYGHHSGVLSGAGP